MKHRDHEDQSAVQGSSFDSREIPCADEQAAHAEADRQQALEDPEDVEWIYLRNKNQQWVARRTPRHLPEEPQSTKKSVLGAVMDNLHLEDLFLK